MRSRRMVFILLAFYFIFIGGSAYYNLIFPVRIFHHFFVTALMAVWYFRKMRWDGLPATPLNAPFFGLGLVLIITAITSTDVRMAFENLWFSLLHLTLFFVLADLFQRGRQKLVLETQFILSALVVIITILELASWYFGLGFTPGTEIGWFNVHPIPLELPRAALAMNISTLLAGYTAPLITLTIGWALTARRPDYRQVLWLLALGLVIVLILTRSRGGLLSVGGAIAAFITMRLLQEEQLKKIISPRLIGGAAVIGAVFLIILFAFSQARTSGDVIRLDLYRSAGEIFADHPLTGVGTGIFGREYREYRTVSINTRDQLVSAHNLYLNTAAENGLLGVAVGVWLGVMLVQAWRKTWQSQITRERKIRVEACIAALIGVGIHHMVDVFTVTPVVSVILVLLAYSVVGHRTVLDAVPKGSKWAAAIGLIVTVSYGVFFLQVDRAQIAYQGSLSGDLELAQQAANLDPHLNLYQLHLAYLHGKAVVENPTQPNIEMAVAAYEHALNLEPTWETGWINLAALEEKRGDIEKAVEYLTIAQSIDPRIYARLHLARLLEQLPDWKDQERIVYYYRSGMHFNLSINQRLPLSPFWQETSLRQKTLARYTFQEDIIQYLGWDRAYRIAVIQDPVYAETLIPDEPQTAAEYWIAGEYALTVLNDPQAAVDHFSAAIQRGRTNGDYYASRARAYQQIDPTKVTRDLDMAQLLGTVAEYPNRIRAELATTQNEKNDYLARAVPTPGIEQAFAAVLFGGRMAVFDVMPEMRPPGPGYTVMQPWYELAEFYRAQGDIERARNIYTAIIDYAPDEQEAITRLEQLQ